MPELPRNKHFEELTRDELVVLLTAYDQYIIRFFDEGNHEDGIGLTPVCVAEFMDNEFQEIINA